MRAENEVGELMVVRLWTFKQMNAEGLCLALFAVVAFASYKEHQYLQMQTVDEGRRGRRLSYADCIARRVDG